MMKRWAILAASVCAASLTAPIASADTGFNLDDLRVTTYDTMLPANAMGLEEDSIAMTKRDERAEQIAENPYLLGSDILVLEELYDDAGQNTIIDGLKKTFPYRTPEVGGSMGEGWKATTGDTKRFDDDSLAGGGVKIFSRYPIKELSQHIFTESCGVNDKTRQGFAYAKVEPAPGTFVHVIGTQVQSYDRKGCPYGGRFEEGADIRTGQYEEIRSFMDGLPEAEPVIVAGDLVADLRQEEYMYMVESLNVVEPERPGPTQFSTNPVTTLDWKAQAMRDYVLFAADHPTPEKLINRVQPIHADKMIVDDYDNALDTLDLSYRHAVTNWDGCADREAECKKYKVTIDEVKIVDDQDPDGWFGWFPNDGDLYGSVLVDGLAVWYHTQDDYRNVSSGGNLDLTPKEARPDLQLVPAEARPNLSESGEVPLDLNVWDDDAIGFGISVGFSGDDEVGIGRAVWRPADGTGQHTAEFNDGSVVVKYTVTEVTNSDISR